MRSRGEEERRGAQGQQRHPGHFYKPLISGRPSRDVLKEPTLFCAPRQHGYDGQGNEGDQEVSTLSFLRTLLSVLRIRHPMFLFVLTIVFCDFGARAF